MNNDSNFLARLESDRLTYNRISLSNPRHITIPRGLCAVCGPNGSGKSTFGTILSKGRYGFGNKIEFFNPDLTARMIVFTDIHSLTGVFSERYTQRLEATFNDLVPTVREIVDLDNPHVRSLCDKFRLTDVADKKVNFLSSGELRKLLLINTLAQKPDLLVIDNPHIGLDAYSRAELDEALKTLSQEGVNVVILVCNQTDIPPFADSVLLMEDLELRRLVTDPAEIERLRQPVPTPQEEIQLPDRVGEEGPDFDVAFSITDGHLTYGSRTILRDVNWTVRRGECWHLEGPNGAGKSLLLSYVNGDHPQAYANRIVLFDRQRGTGESIWEIKKRVGYINPDMMIYYKTRHNVASILRESMRSPHRRFIPVSDREPEIVDQWLELARIPHLKDREFNTLSDGEKRLVLLIASIIKQPELLILDEPFHGLDAPTRARMLQLIDRLVRGNKSNQAPQAPQANNTTLIFVTHDPTDLPTCITHTFHLPKRLS